MKTPLIERSSFSMEGTASRGTAAHLDRLRNHIRPATKG
jgi:hypothetical protein